MPDEHKICRRPLTVDGLREAIGDDNSRSHRTRENQRELRIFGKDEPDNGDDEDDMGRTTGPDVIVSPIITAVTSGDRCACIHCACGLSQLATPEWLRTPIRMTVKHSTRRTIRTVAEMWSNRRA